MSMDFTMFEKKKKGNVNYYLVANYSKSLSLSQTKLKEQIRNRALFVNNVHIDNTGKIVEVQNNSSFKNEWELFLYNIVEKINYCNTDLSIMLDFVSKLRMINQREVEYENDKKLRELCVKVLTLFFNYLGKTKYKFFDKNFYEVMSLKSNFNIKLEEEKENILYNNISVNSGLSNWYQNINNPYLYKEICIELNKAIRLPYSVDRKKLISLYLDIIEKLLNSLEFSLTFPYLYLNYMLVLSEKFTDCVKNHNIDNFRLPEINEKDRIKVLKELCGRTSKEYNNCKKYIARNSDRFNDLIQHYTPQTDALLMCFSIQNLTSNQMSVTDKRKFDKFLFEKRKEVLKFYNGIVYVINNSENGKENKTVEIAEGVKNFVECLSITGCTPFNLGLSALNVAKPLFEILRDGVDSCCKDYLSKESYEILGKFQNLSEGKRDILYYLLDLYRIQKKFYTRQYNSVSEMYWNKALKMKRYSPYTLSFLVDLMHFYDIGFDTQYASGSDYVLTFASKGNLEESWLTANYIIKECVEKNSYYIRNNLVNLLYRYCERIYNLKNDVKDSKAIDISVLVHFFSSHYNISLRGLKDVNLFLLLKEEYRK